MAVLGNFKPLEPSSSLTLVAPDNEQGGAASDKVATPASAFAGELERRGFRVTRAFYDRDKLEQDKKSVLAKVKQNNVTLFVTTSRTRLKEEEVALGLQVARLAETFVHVALWNPYHVTDLPGPAVVSFGFRPASLRAVAAVLTGAPARGTPPILLTPHLA